MFHSFVDALRTAGIPVSIREHLVLLEAIERDVIDRTPDAFYYLARTTFVKDEALVDRFDRVFAQVFGGLGGPVGVDPAMLPEDWLRAIAARYLSPEAMAKIAPTGDRDALMALLRQRLSEQHDRHEGAPNGSAPAVPARSAMAAITQKGSASAVRAATSAR